MGWNKIKDRIHEPILDSDTVEAIIKSCMEKDGTNKEHSRRIKTETYIEPINDEESLDKDTIESFKYEIIRHMAQSLLKDIPQEDRAKVSLPISNYIDGWDMLSSVRIGDLRSISNMPNDRIAEYLSKENGKNPAIDFIKMVYSQCCDFETEHNGSNPPYHVEKASRDEKNSDPLGYGYNKRIYLNPPTRNISTFKFLTEYIKKCIDKRMPFDMKGFGSLRHSEEELDGMILYSNNTYLDRHIDILEQVIKDNPDLINTFGNPICTGGMVTGEDDICHYTIASGSPQGGKTEGGKMVYGEYKTGTYNDYIDNAINFTYTIACSKLIHEYSSLLRGMGETAFLEDEFMKTIEFFENLEECPSNEIRKKIFLINSTSLEFGKNARKIRELAYKVIDFKEMTGTEEKVMEKLKSSFSDNFRMICSVLKFNDKDHIDTPIYQDESFIDFAEGHEIKDRVPMPEEMLDYSEAIQEAETTIRDNFTKDEKPNILDKQDDGNR